MHCCCSPQRARPRPLTAPHGPSGPVSIRFGPGPLCAAYLSSPYPIRTVPKTCRAIKHMDTRTAAHLAKSLHLAALLAPLLPCSMACPYPAVEYSARKVSAAHVSMQHIIFSWVLFLFHCCSAKLQNVISFQFQCLTRRHPPPTAHRPSPLRQSVPGRPWPVGNLPWTWRFFACNFFALASATYSVSLCCWLACSPVCLHVPRPHSTPQFWRPSDKLKIARHTAAKGWRLLEGVVGVASEEFR